MSSGNLSIQIMPFGNDADLIINGKHYVLRTDLITDLGGLRQLLNDQPNYIFDAVLGVMKGMMK